MVKILAALVAALSILNSSGVSPGATEKVAALVARASCGGASHSSAYHTVFTLLLTLKLQSSNYCTFIRNIVHYLEIYNYRNCTFNFLKFGPLHICVEVTLFFSLSLDQLFYLTGYSLYTYFNK